MEGSLDSEDWLLGSLRCLRVKGISLWDPLPGCCFSFLIPPSPGMKLAAILEANSSCPYHYML